MQEKRNESMDTSMSEEMAGGDLPLGCKSTDCILLWVCCICRTLAWVLRLLCFCILIWNLKMELLTVKIYLYSQTRWGFHHLIVHCAWKTQTCPQGLLCPPRESCKQKEGRRPCMLMYSCELADKLRERCISGIQDREKQDGWTESSF